MLRLEERWVGYADIRCIGGRRRVGPSRLSWWSRARGLL